MDQPSPSLKNLRIREGYIQLRAAQETAKLPDLAVPRSAQAMDDTGPNQARRDTRLGRAIFRRCDSPNEARDLLETLLLDPQGWLTLPLVLGGTHDHRGE